VKIKLNQYLIDDIKNKNHPSDFETTKEYSVLILRLPYIKNDRVEIVSYAFVIADRIYRYSRSRGEFVELGDFNDLHDYLDVRIDKILAKISRLHAQIDAMEDRLYSEDLDADFAKEWLSIKKDLSLIERLMGHSIIAFGRFVKHYRPQLDELAYRDLDEHIHRAHNFAKSGLEKLDNLFSFYKIRVDERSNRIMFLLTIISAIFLPLTLVTGFFGMNTGGLPLTDDPHGTLKVSIGVLLFEIPFIAWIWYMTRRS
jgi:magnesium transporter